MIGPTEPPVLTTVVVFTDELVVLVVAALALPTATVRAATAKVAAINRRARRVALARELLSIF
ncbi:MAG: hypothetical protein U0Y82_16785 [Thermoleophilia bacterium]